MDAARKKWLGAAAVVLVLAGLASPAQAQYFGRGRQPGYGTPAYQAYVASLRAYQWAALNQAAVWPYYGSPWASPGYAGNPWAYSGSYGYYPGYTNPYPYGSYLRGAADVISSQSRYLVGLQEANLLREQVRARRIENRKSAFDQYLYEKENTPTPEQLRTEERLLRRERARLDPPLTEIYSAISLNDLLADLQRLSLTGIQDVPVDPETVRRVNVTTARNGANIGLLRQGSRLTWPAALGGDAYREPRARVSALAQQAVDRARQGLKVDSGTLQQLYDDVDRLHQRLDAAVNELGASEYITGKRFLHQLGDGFKALQQPDAPNHFNGHYAFQGKTVTELVKFMKERGLWFAPANPGDEPAYTVVHKALAAYSTAAHTAELRAGVTRR